MMQVAGYCRVSTDREDQANSFEAQQRYFREYIGRHPKWELYGIYADEGITGTSTRKRAQFNRMIQDAREGRFQLILTKEVSRFSRNILDTISYTRELKSLGIGVWFLTDGIHTLEPDAELRLSIMASIAQEESRKTSSRVKWGQTRQMERGVVFGRSMLGYDVANGAMTVNPEGAELVRLIFRKYGLEGKGTTVIARELQGAGYRTYTGSPKWSNSHLIKILKNEKYVGDLVQKKTYTPDYLTHKKKYNHGQEELVILRDHHEPIVERALWDRVQEELARRNRHGGQVGGSNRYALSGKIKCGVCGAGFVSRRRRRKDGGVDKRWGCATVARGEKAGCDVGRMLREDVALDMLRQALGALEMDMEGIVGHVTALAMEAIRSEGEDADQVAFQMERVRRKKETVLDAFFAGDISREEMLAMKDRYDKDLTGLQERWKRAKAAPARVADQTAQDELREEVFGLLSGTIPSDALGRQILERITVYRDRRLELKFLHLPQVLRFMG